MLATSSLRKATFLATDLTLPLGSKPSQSLAAFASPMTHIGKCALAHAYAAWCHEIRFLRAGQKSDDRDAAIRHAHAAIANGPDDATALALAGFVMAIVAHDMPTARKAFDQALTISPSSFFALAFGGTAVGWKGDASAQSTGASAQSGSVRSIACSICPNTRSQSAIFCWDATTRPQRRRGRRSTRSRSSASRMSSWRLHLLPQGTWTKRGPLLHVLWRCNLASVRAGSVPRSRCRPPSPHHFPRRSGRRACRTSRRDQKRANTEVTCVGSCL